MCIIGVEIPEGQNSEESMGIMINEGVGSKGERVPHRIEM